MEDFIINQDLSRHHGENYMDYMIRLCDNKDEYGITYSDIAALLNAVNGNSYTECTYRKYYKAFNEGREYERNRYTTRPFRRILSISDLHVPFQKPKEVFADFVGIIDVLQINGDIVDCSSISKFPKVYRSSPMEEIITARQYLIELIEYLQPKKVVAVYGNHDIRMENYLAKNLDTDLLELMPRTSLELIFDDGFTHYDKRTRAKVKYEPLRDIFDDVEIEYIDSWWCQIGRTIFAHPLAFNSGIMKTAERAMSFFRNEGYDFSSLVMAHTHRIGNYIVGNTTIFEQGACCETKKMSYSDGKLVNSQKEGFLYLEQDEDGDVVYHNQIVLN